MALPHLQQHVPRFDASVCSHSSSLHDGADVDAPVPPLVALAHDADAQEVVLLCVVEKPDRALTYIGLKKRSTSETNIRSLQTHVESDSDDV